jgi:hypothetical protein
MPIDKSPDKVQAAVNSYIALVDNNNGVREKDICRMLFPIGIQYNDLNATWLGIMDSFGQIRGSVAHTSIQIQQPLDPLGESKKINHILRGLRKLDTKLTSLI